METNTEPKEVESTNQNTQLNQNHDFNGALAQIDWGAANDQELEELQQVKQEDTKYGRLMADATAKPMDIEPNCIQNSAKRLNFLSMQQAGLCAHFNGKECEPRNDGGTKTSASSSSSSTTTTNSGDGIEGGGGGGAKAVVLNQFMVDAQNLKG